MSKDLHAEDLTSQLRSMPVDQKINLIAHMMESTKTFSMFWVGDAKIMSIHTSFKINRAFLRAMRDAFLPANDLKAIGFSGLANDPRNTWEVPEVQELCYKIGLVFPNILVDERFEVDTRKTFALAELAYIGGKVKQLSEARDKIVNVKTMFDLQNSFHIEVEIPDNARPELVLALNNLESSFLYKSEDVNSFQQ